MNIDGLPWHGKVPLASFDISVAALGVRLMTLVFLHGMECMTGSFPIPHNVVG